LPVIGGDWLVTDLSPAMVAAARVSVGADKAQFRVMDAEQPDAPLGLFDLVVSNLAAQWFADLPRAVRQLGARLAPGGRLVFSTLGRESFAEWRSAHERLNLSCGIPAYPSPEELAAQLPAGSQVVRHRVVVPHADAHAFLTALKRIGAGTPSPSHQPLSPGALRRVMKAMGAPVAITYDLLFAVVTAE